MIFLRCMKLSKLYEKLTLYEGAIEVLDQALELARVNLGYDSQEVKDICSELRRFQALLED